MKKIILHACCAPCASYPIKKLIEDNFKPVVFFYNPNIFPYDEYLIRKDELLNYCLKNSIDFFEEKYCPKEYYDVIKGLEKEPEKGKRCEICFYLRLFKTAQFAFEKGINLYTTTLSVSPHKNSKQIFDAAKKVKIKIPQIDFIEYNFKKQDGFKISRIIAKENNMYAQSYCGCEYSIKN